MRMIIRSWTSKMTREAVVLLNKSDLEPVVSPRKEVEGGRDIR